MLQAAIAEARADRGPGDDPAEPGADTCGRTVEPSPVARGEPPVPLQRVAAPPGVLLTAPGAAEIPASGVRVDPAGDSQPGLGTGVPDRADELPARIQEGEALRLGALPPKVPASAGEPAAATPEVELGPGEADAERALELERGERIGRLEGDVASRVGAVEGERPKGGVRRDRGPPPGSERCPAKPEAAAVAVVGGYVPGLVPGAAERFRRIRGVGRQWIGPPIRKSRQSRPWTRNPAPARPDRSQGRPSVQAATVMKAGREGTR